MIFPVTRGVTYVIENCSGIARETVHHESINQSIKYYFNKLCGAQKLTGSWPALSAAHRNNWNWNTAE